MFNYSINASLIAHVGDMNNRLKFQCARFKKWMIIVLADQVEL
jgi:hypothetical protein